MTTQTAKPGYGVWSVSPEILADVLCLPQGYSIAGLWFDAHGALELLLCSEQLPPWSGGLPVHVVARHTVHTLPDQPPQYRYITTEIEPA